MGREQSEASDTSAEKSGALIIDLEGCSLGDDEVKLLQDPRVSGVIFFARNFECPSQLKELVTQVRAVDPGLILCVDQEGGRVQRFASGMSSLPSFRQLAKAGPDACEDLAWLMAREILSLGVDLSFTPVLDINFDRNTVIGDRAFGTNAATVITCAQAYLRGLARAGMAATGKHFPGHGWVDLDSHIAMPVDDRSYEAIAADMSVFESLSSELTAVMTAHVLYTQVDSQIATYSKKWLDLLRDQVGFEGLVISDDLAMAGATGIEKVCDRAEAALSAGCDLLLMCNNRKAVLELLESNTPWYTDKSISGLQGRVSQENLLVDDQEYQSVRQRWGMLLKEAASV